MVLARSGGEHEVKHPVINHLGGKSIKKPLATATLASLGAKSRFWDSKIERVTFSLIFVSKVEKVVIPHFSHFGEKWPGDNTFGSARHSHPEPRESRDAFLHSQELIS